MTENTVIRHCRINYIWSDKICEGTAHLHISMWKLPQIENSYAYNLKILLKGHQDAWLLINVEFGWWLTQVHYTLVT